MHAEFERNTVDTLMGSVASPYQVMYAVDMFDFDGELEGDDVDGGCEEG